MGRINQIKNYVEELKDNFPDLKVFGEVNGAKPMRYVLLYATRGEIGASVYARITASREKLRCRVGAEIYGFNIFKGSLIMPGQEGNASLESLEKTLDEIKRNGLDASKPWMEEKHILFSEERMLWVDRS